MKAILLHIVSKTVAHIIILEIRNHLGFLRTETAYLDALTYLMGSYQFGYLPPHWTTTKREGHLAHLCKSNRHSAWYKVCA